MKTSNPSIRKLAGDALLLGAIMLTNKILDKTKKQVDRKDDKTLDRKLTMVSIIYHAIGIFYNE